MGVRFSSSGSFKNTLNFLNTVKTNNYMDPIESIAKEGVSLLQAATPVDSGNTKDSWDYIIKREGKSASIIWTNSNINNGVPIAIILQYGHGTRNGGWVEGRDYINPATQDLLDKAIKDIWSKVTSA